MRKITETGLRKNLEKTVFVENSDGLLYCGENGILIENKYGFCILVSELDKQGKPKRVYHNRKINHGDVIAIVYSPNPHCVYEVDLSHYQREVV